MLKFIKKIGLFEISQYDLHIVVSNDLALLRERVRHHSIASYIHSALFACFVLIMLHTAYQLIFNEFTYRNLIHFVLSIPLATMHWKLKSKHIDAELLFEGKVVQVVGEQVREKIKRDNAPRSKRK